MHCIEIRLTRWLGNLDPEQRVAGSITSRSNRIFDWSTNSCFVFECYIYVYMKLYVIFLCIPGLYTVE